MPEDLIPVLSYKDLQNLTDPSNPVKTGGCCRRLNVLRSASRLSYVFHMCSEWTQSVKRTQCHFRCSSGTRVPGCNCRDINPSCYRHLVCFYIDSDRYALHTLDTAPWHTANLLAITVHGCAVLEELRYLAVCGQILVNTSASGVGSGKKKSKFKQQSARDEKR